MNTLREYLTCEYEVKMNKRRVFDTTNMPGQSVPSPIQPNLNDCGLFVLQNIEQFFKVVNEIFDFRHFFVLLKIVIYLQDPIKNFELPIKDLENWYDIEVATRKRRDIAELIQRLMSTHGTGFPIEDLPNIELPE